MAAPRRHRGAARRRLVAAARGRRPHRDPQAGLGDRRRHRELGRPAGVQPGGLGRHRARRGVADAVRGHRGDAGPRRGPGPRGADVRGRRRPASCRSSAARRRLPGRRSRRCRTRTWTTSRRSCASTASPDVRRNDLAAQVARHRLHARLNGAIASLPETAGHPDVRRRPGRLRRQRRRPRPAGRRHPDPGGLEVAARPGPDRAGAGGPGLRGRAGLLAARGAVAVRARRQRRHRDGLPDRRPRGAAPADRLRAGAGGGHADGRRRARTSTSSTRSGRLGAPVRVALDVDAGLRLGPAHVGPLRSPLFDAADVVELAQEIGRRDGLPAGRGDDLRGPGRRGARRGAAAPVPLGRRTPGQGAVISVAVVAFGRQFYTALGGEGGSLEAASPTRTWCSPAPGSCGL